MKFATAKPSVWNCIVAPHWGAWIEIGLTLTGIGHACGRTPLGCVD